MKREAIGWSQVDEIVLETDPAGHVTWANMHARVMLPNAVERRALADLVDVDPDELRVWLNQAANDTVPRQRTVAMQARAGTARVALHVERRSGDGPIRVRVSLVDDDADPTNGALLRALQELRYALDQATIVAVTDRKGVIVHVNEQFCAISGYAREELLGQTHRVIRSDHHDRAFFKDLWATIGRGHVWRGEICNRAKDGGLYWVDTTIVPLVDEAARPQRYLAVRSDITQAKRTQAELQAAVADLEAMNAKIASDQGRQLRAEKLSSVGQLAAGVAHEINNPLAGAIACVRSLRDGAVAGERRALYFETVLDSLSRIRGTVRALLDYARPLPPSNTAVALDEIARANATLLHSICQKKLVEIRVADAPPDVLARGDRSQLSQVLMNVLMNAADAAPSRSVVEVTFDVVDDHLRVHVRDEGPGIPPDVRRRIFDPFFSTKPEGEGTGLGLSVTLGIVEQHEGEIDVDCPHGGGTCFTIGLPIYHPG